MIYDLSRYHQAHITSLESGLVNRAEQVKENQVEEIH